jgi:hypothetical protein
MSILKKIEDYCIKHNIHLLYGDYAGEDNVVYVNTNKTTIDQFLNLSHILSSNNLVIHLQEFSEEEVEIEGFEQHFGHIHSIDLMYIKEGFVYKYEFSEEWYLEYIQLLNHYEAGDEGFDDDYLN